MGIGDRSCGTVNIVRTTEGEVLWCVMDLVLCVFFFQAEDGIRVLVRYRGLGDVYKGQQWPSVM